MAAIELPTRERMGQLGEVDRKAIEAKVAVQREIGDQLRAKLGKADRFTTVFDVCEDRPTSAHEIEADHGSVANDLAEIHGDLKEALARDDSDDALWDTRFHFDHRGMHASAVLHPLHQLAWDWEGELD